jgi:hypothetical protein
MPLNFVAYALLDVLFLTARGVLRHESVKSFRIYWLWRSRKGRLTLFQARKLASARTALQAVAATLFLSSFSAMASPAKGSSDTCGGDSAGIAVLASPVAPWKGAPLRVILTVEEPLEGELSLIAPNGSVAAKSGERHGGPPYFWYAEVRSPAAGTWRVRLAPGVTPAGCSAITREIAVLGGQPPRPHSAENGLWQLRNTWNRGTENLYSAWIEKLFDAPLDAAPSWPALHEVLRDRSRNILFNHLGLGEDQMRMVIRPDCADLPYFLRAYFAFKMGLPFGYSKCSRGGGGQPPKCHEWWNIQHLEEDRPPPPEQNTAPAGFFDFGQRLSRPATKPATKPALKNLGLAAAFGQYLRTLADGVHSGSGRTAAGDDNTDYYPILLKEETLRPGTVYADPYGHMLTLVRRIPQSAGAAGVFLAVDGQPDGTVARRRFWRGNFLFAKDPALGSPGFKRFRPILSEKKGVLRRLTNAEIAKNPQYADFSLDQSRLSIEDFYDRMDDVMSPEPLDPLHAMQEVITALEEQVKARVTSVENGRKFLSSSPGDAAMPEGVSIFETTGAWEDFATPSRDLRLLIAIDVLQGFPDRVARRPERYAMPKDRSATGVKAQLESVLASELPARKFSYMRTDGSQWTLTLKEVIDRAPALEMAYNLNDCVELRWGAQEGSDEASACKRHAPQAQRGKMAEYRMWFHERRRPPRA